MFTGPHQSGQLRLRGRVTQRNVLDTDASIVAAPNINSMTLGELCAYLGHASPDDVFQHVRAKRLPSAEGGFGVRDPGARWNQAKVDRALDKA